MACKTCDHTMQCAFADQHGRGFWCSRCGTYKLELNDPDTSESHVETSIPMLVNRIKEFLKNHINEDELIEELHVLGVLESVYLPKEREQFRR